ncbi:MAG: metallophosphoesterase [Candidatus Aenigmarchaeota archaeon]|nr:metallophosphoesterase [Candidatus Aenigmarchaeota archaeon]
MRLLVIADIHGRYQKLRKLLAKIDEKFDVVVCPGDFTDMHNIPREFSQMDVADIVAQSLIATRKPVVGIPGNHDPYDIVGLLEEYGISAHARVRKIDNMNFLGYGGAETPFNTLFEPSEDEIKKALDALAGTITGDFVLVTHNPAKDTKLDSVQGTHVGSQSVRDFILKNKPTLAISAHIHEAMGVDTLGTTTLFYPGPCHEGRYGLVDISTAGITCVSKRIEFQHI